MKAKGLVSILICLVCSGCSLLQRTGLIKSKGVSVAAVADAGKPATLNTSDGHESVPIPKDTTVTITEHEATPTAPAYKVTELHFNSPTEWQKFNTTVAANTGTVDTSVAEKKIEVQAAQPLLYAAILGVLGAIIFVYLHYPTPAMLCGASAGLFFLAWRLSDLPSWVWALAAAAIATGVGMYFAHSRGLSDAAASSKNAT